ncbi:MAG: glycosyltransferase family 1 protein [Thermogemmata sp.]|nr:glycosyltransferase family 1 protein [Thermogemmata sp.]
MSLRVGFNAYLLSHPSLRGWNRYTVNLLAALPAQGVRPVLYSLAPIHPDHLARLPPDCYEVKVAPPMRYLWFENVWLPRQLRRDHIDVFHCPMNYGLPWSTPCPRVLTLHDAIDQVYYGRRSPWSQRWRWSSIRSRLANWAARHRAHHIITVSGHAKDDIVRHLGVAPDKISVIYEAADPLFHKPITPEAVAEVRRRWGLERPYFLYVGGWEQRKNVPFLIRAYAAAKLEGVELVLAGGRPSEYASLEQLAEQAGCLGQLHLLGWVPDSDLPGLYAGALAFVYPSEYEGFGLQVCEAMAVGCPVLAARATSLPEILGSGGLTFTLDGPEELAILLRRLAQESAFRQDLSDRARRRAATFSWDYTAAATAKVYCQLTDR